MKQQFLILGAGKFGQSMARRLQELEQEVMVVDMDPEVIARLSEEIEFAVEGDVTHEATLKELGVRNFDVVVVSIGDDIQASIMTTILLKELGCEQVVCKAESDLHAKVLYKIGASRVVIPEMEMGVRIAQNLVNKNILDFINLSDDYTIVEMPVLSDWSSHTVGQLNLRGKHGLNIIAIRHGSDFTIKISPDTVLQREDTILVIGETEEIEKLSKRD